MTRLYFILFIVLGLFDSCNQEADVEPGDSDTFIKLYAGITNESANDMLVENDGSVIILATQEGIDGGAAKLKVLHVDNYGNTIWEATYEGEVSEESEESYIGSSLRKADNGYIIVGTSIKDDIRSVLLLEIDQGGTMLNQEKYSIENINIDGIDAIMTDNGELKVYGIVEDNTEQIWIGTYASGPAAEPTCVKKYNSTLDNTTGFKKMFLANDEIIIGVSGIQSAENKQNSKLIPIGTECLSLASSGPSLSSDGSGNEYLGTGLTETLTGYAMVGTQSFTGDTDIFMAKLNAQGILQGDIVIYPSAGEFTLNGDEEGLAITNTRDGGLLIGGSSESNADGGSDIILIKTAFDGSVQWIQFYGDANDEQANVVRQSTDGGYFILGETEFGGINTLILIKTDNQGLVN